MRISLLLLVPLIFLSATAFAKRKINPKTEPITKDGVTYSYKFERFYSPEKFYRNSIAANRTKPDGKPGKLLWSTLISTGTYAAGGEMEEIIVSSIELENGIVNAIDVRYQKFKVDAKTGKLIEPKEPIKNTVPPGGP